MDKRKANIMNFGIGSLGVIFLIIPFFIDCSDFENLFSGLGTGFITSLLVSIFINKANEKIADNQRQRDKLLLLNNLKISASYVYSNTLYKMNKYLLLTKCDIKPFYDIKNNIDKLKQLCLQLSSKKDIGINEKELFDFNSIFFESYVSELKHFSKTQFFLASFISEDELKKLPSEQFIEHYVSIYSLLHNKRAKCKLKDKIDFLKITLLSCRKHLEGFGLSESEINNLERDVESQIDQFYYDVIYTQSEEYIEQEIQRIQDEQQYYEDNPEAYNDIIKYYDDFDNYDQTDDTLTLIRAYLYGSYWGSFDELLKKVDKNDDRVKYFLLQNDIKKRILNNREIKKVFSDIYGTDYLKKLYNNVKL